jgi:hypothetical protein
MRQPDFPPALPSTRRDGWTIRRQFAFLDALVRTGSVIAAASAAGMSRESAYRLRRRASAALFAAAWDRALEGHSRVKFGADLSPRARGGFPAKSTKGHKVNDPPDATHNARPGAVFETFGGAG